MPDPTPARGAEDQLRAALRDTIPAAGRHQVTIADDLGITTKHLCAMLTGRARLTLDWAERIAEACGCEVAVGVVDLAAGPEEPAHPQGIPESMMQRISGACLNDDAGDDALTVVRPVEQCGASTGPFRLGDNPSHYLGPCVLRHDHDGPVHQADDGVQWAGTIGGTAPKPRQDVPDDLVDDAVDAWHTAPRNEHGKIPLDDHMRHVLAETLPILLPAYERAVRDHIAAEIEAACVDPDWPNDDISQNGQKAARIARGETR